MIPPTGRLAIGAVYLASVLLASRAAYGNVSLLFAQPTMNVAPNGSFTLTLDISINSETVSAVDFWLTSPTATIFDLTSRNYSGSSFNAAVIDDASVVPYYTPVTSTETSNFSADLGSAFTSTEVTGPGTYLVTKLNLTLTSAALAHQTYTISTADPSSPTLGWAGATEQGGAYSPFYSQATANITVTPEPASAMLVGMSAIVGLLQRRRRRGLHVGR